MLNENLNVPRHLSDKFHYSKRAKEFVADISDLGKAPFGQIYTDACDSGFIIVSDRTSHTALWYLAEGETKRDADGDIVWWKLFPTDTTVRKCPVLKDHVITLFND
jgi:hypothetical protein